VLENTTKIHEFHDRIELLEALPKGGRVAEVGVLTGTFSKQINDIVKPDELHLIDRWTYIWMDGQKLEIGDELEEQVRTTFKDCSNVFIHRTTSLEASKLFPKRYFDWVYLDAGHQYHEIKEDIEVYRGLVKKWLIGHDFISAETFGTSVIRAVIEATELYNMRLIALTAYDDIPRAPGVEPDFPWGERPISWALEVPEAE